MLPTSAPRPRGDLICFSHLRWNFVFQRPQHLMTRCARDRRVVFVEEPLYRTGTTPHYELETGGPVTVAVPHLPDDLDEAGAIAAQRAMLDDLIADLRLDQVVLWYYTPMALAFSDHLAPRAIVYDCMDELAAFKDAPRALKDYETALMARADLVLTGGQSLYEAKRHLHRNIHPFPSSVDAPHFAQARRIASEPPDQAAIPRPRLGFFGVIDERLDTALIERVAALRPDWQIVLVGPIVKIDHASLPHRSNIHYLGSKNYPELPAYVAGWDVALLPFARNEATRFISPTKTPEYMAAGRPVVSTSIRDVVRPYGERGLVRIADEAEAFVRACVAAMAEDGAKRDTRADAFLRQTSWDGTWARIARLIDELLYDDLTDREDATDSAAAV